LQGRFQVVVKTEDEHPLSGPGTDVGMHAHHLNARFFLDEPGEISTATLDHPSSHLLDEFDAPLFVAELALGRAQDALQLHDDEIFDDERLCLLRPSAEMVALKLRDALGDRSFDLSFCFFEGDGQLGKGTGNWDMLDR